MEIREQEIAIKSHDGIDLQSFLCYPKKEENWPGILLIHEIWALNDQIRGVARRYAQEGFLVLAPNFFSRYGTALEENKLRKAMGSVFAIPPEQRRNAETLQNLMKTVPPDEKNIIKILFAERATLIQEMVKDVKSIYEFFHNLNNLNREKLGISGFCMGGGLAFQIATQLPFQAAVIFYGGNPDPIEAISKLNGPVLGLYAGEDKMVNVGIPALVTAMSNAKQTLCIKIYAKMQHGFFNETSSLYSKEEAEDAWRLALSHFKRYLSNNKM